MTPPSIRTYLLLLVLAAGLPLIGAAGYGIYQDMRQQVETAKISLRTLTTTMVRNTNDRIVNQRRLLERLAVRPLVRRLDASNCDPILKDLLDLHPDYANVTYTDADGVVVCSAMPPPSGRLVDVGKAPWFQSFIKTGYFNVGDPFFGPITGKWVSVLSAPVWNDNRKIVGGVQFPIDLKTLDPNIEIQFLPAGSRYGLLSGSGFLLWHNIDAQEMIGTHAPSAAARRAIEVGQGEFEDTGSDGVLRFYSVMPVPEAGWVAFIGVPVSAVYAPARERAAIEAAAALLAIFLLLLLATIIARRIAKPILELKNAAKQIEGGNMETIAVVTGPREVAQVGAALSSMTNRFRTSTRLLESEIHQRKETEIALRRSEERISLVLRGTNEGIWDWDLPGNALFYSERWWTMLGYAENELPADTALWQRLLHPDDLQHVNDAFRSALTSGRTSYEVEFRLRCKDGSYLPVASRGFITRDESGRAVRVSGTNRDLRDRKRAEAAMIQAKRLHEQAETLGNAGGWELDIDTGKQLWTHQTYKIHEVDTDFEPTIHNALLFYTPESARTIKGAVRRMVEHGESFDLELEITTAKGNRRHVRAVGKPDLENRKVYGFFQDITESKLKEAELHAARADAEKANSAKSRFLAAASHDLRQPLSALSLYVGLLMRRTAPREAELVGSIQECTDSLNTLLSDLLDISKLDAGVLVPKPVDFSVAELLASLVSVHGGEAANKGLSLRWRRCCATVHGDRQLLQRIVANFVSNAIRYTDTGGVLVACRRRQGKRWIEVWDTGKGIAAADTARVFEEFVQLDEGAPGGSGLGLAIATRSAELLGLQIRVGSRPGRGSVFAIELPDETPAIDAQVPQSRPPVASALTIAVADDDSRILGALVASLEHLGHRVIAATSADALMEGLGGQRPDLVISDYRLGAGTNGFNLIAAVRKAFDDGIPAALISGDTDPALVRRFADSGIPVYYKPLQMETLLAILDETTKGRNA